MKGLHDRAVLPGHQQDGVGSVPAQPADGVRTGPAHQLRRGPLSGDAARAAHALSRLAQGDHQSGDVPTASEHRARLHREQETGRVGRPVRLHPEAHHPGLAGLLVATREAAVGEVGLQVHDGPVGHAVSRRQVAHLQPVRRDRGEIRRRLGAEQPEDAAVAGDGVPAVLAGQDSGQRPIGVVDVTSADRGLDAGRVRRRAGSRRVRRLQAGWPDAQRREATRDGQRRNHGDEADPAPGAAAGPGPPGGPRIRGDVIGDLCHQVVQTVAQVGGHRFPSSTRDESSSGASTRSRSRAVRACDFTVFTEQPRTAAVCTSVRSS